MSGSVIGEYNLIEGCIIQENASTGQVCNIGINGNQPNSEAAITVIGPGISVPPFTTLFKGNNLLSDNI